MALLRVSAGEEDRGEKGMEKRLVSFCTFRSCPFDKGGTTNSQARSAFQSFVLAHG